MPQFVVFIYSPDTAVAQTADLDAHDRHAHELSESGAMRAAYALESRAAARSITSTGALPGPYPSGEPGIAGLYVLEATDLDAACRIAALNPIIAQGGGVEIRQVATGGAVNN